MTIKSIAAKATIFLALVAALNLPGLAQTGTSILTWDLQLPMADSKDFLGRGTLTARGVGFQIRRQMRENIWAGAYIGAKYHFGFKNSKTISGDSTGLSYLSISIGVAFDHGFF